MSTLIILIPIAFIMSLLGLASFLWSIKSKQYEDLEGSANRILFDDVSFVEDRTIWDGEERPDYETNKLFWWSERERDQFEDGKFT